MARTIEFDIEVNGIEELANSVLSARQQLKLLTDVINSEKLSGDKLRQAEAAAGALRDRIGDTRQRINALASDTAKLDAFVAGVGGIAAAFSVAQGAAALFGDENEDLQQAILKTQGALALLNGVQQISNLLNKDSAFVTIASATAQRAYAAAVAFSTGALGAFRTALIATGIGAAVVAIGALVANWDRLTSSIKKSNDSLKESKKLNEESLKASQSDISNLKLLETQINNENLSRDKKNKLIDEAVKKYPGLLNNYTKEKLLNGEINSSVKEQINLILAREKVKILSSEFAVKQIEEQRKLNELNEQFAQLRLDNALLPEELFNEATETKRLKSAITTQQNLLKGLESSYQKQVGDIIKNNPSIFDVVTTGDSKKLKDGEKSDAEKKLEERFNNFFRLQTQKNEDFFTQQSTLYKEQYIDGIIKSEEELNSFLDQNELLRLNSRKQFLQELLLDVQTNATLSAELRITKEEEIATQIISINQQIADKTIAINKRVSDSTEKTRQTGLDDFNKDLTKREQEINDKLKLINSQFFKEQTELYGLLLTNLQKDSILQRKILLEGTKGNIIELIDDGGKVKKSVVDQRKVIDEFFKIFTDYRNLLSRGSNFTTQEILKLLVDYQKFYEQFGGVILDNRNSFAIYQKDLEGFLLGISSFFQDDKSNLDISLFLEEKYKKDLENLRKDINDNKIKSEEELNDRLRLLQTQKSRSESLIIKKEIDLIDEKIKKEVEGSDNYKLLKERKLKLDEEYIKKLNDISQAEIDIVTDLLNKNKKLQDDIRDSILLSFQEIINVFNLTGTAIEVGIGGLLGTFTKNIQRFFNITRGASKKEFEKSKSDLEKARGEMDKAETPEDIETAFKNVQKARAEFESASKLRKEFRLDTTAAAASLLGGLGDTIGQIGQTIEQERLGRLKRENDEAISLLNERFNQGLISEQEYNNQRNKLNEKYLQEETKIKRKAFNIDKAAKISQAVAGTALAVVTALSAGPVAGPIMAGIIGTLGAVQVGLIASQKFDGSSTEVQKVAGDLGSVGGESIATERAKLPTFNVNTGQIEGSNLLMSGGISGERRGGSTQQVVVLESDIREVSNRVQVYESRSKFG